MLVQIKLLYGITSCKGETNSATQNSTSDHITFTVKPQILYIGGSVLFLQLCRTLRLTLIRHLGEAHPERRVHVTSRCSRTVRARETSLFQTEERHVLVSLRRVEFLVLQWNCCIRRSCFGFKNKITTCNSRTLFMQMIKVVVKQHLSHRPDTIRSPLLV